MSNPNANPYATSAVPEPTKRKSPNRLLLLAMFGLIGFFAMMVTFYFAIGAKREQIQAEKARVEAIQQAKAADLNQADE